jgi:polyhydroxyalkanoate synthesis regulator protein
MRIKYPFMVIELSDKETPLGIMREWGNVAITSHNEALGQGYSAAGERMGDEIGKAVARKIDETHPTHIVNLWGEIAQQNMNLFTSMARTMNPMFAMWEAMASRVQQQPGQEDSAQDESPNEPEDPNMP